MTAKRTTAVARPARHPERAQLTLAQRLERAVGEFQACDARLGELARESELQARRREQLRGAVATLQELVDAGP